VALAPFSVSQLRLALYPQLAASGGFEVAQLAAKKETQRAYALSAGAPGVPPAANYLRPPMTTNAPPPPAPAYVPPAFVQEAMVSAARRRLTIQRRGGQGNRPKTATLFVVATKTFPSATTGTMFLLPAPNWSRPLDAWLLLYNSVARLVAA
jgi:hypothetical protein